MSESTGLPENRPGAAGQLQFGFALLLVLLPHIVLLLLTLGSGWSFPRLLPDRMDFGPWRDLAILSDLSDGALCGTLLSLTSGSFSTVFGLLLSRSIHQLTGSFQRLGRAAVLFPFAISPAVVAVCLFDLTVRMGWAGTFTGVLACQTIFGSAAAAVILLDGWGETERRRELLVRMLGGGTFDVWRHAIWPHARGLLGMCFLQMPCFRGWIMELCCISVGAECRR